MRLEQLKRHHDSISRGDGVKIDKDRVSLTDSDVKSSSDDSIQILVHHLKNLSLEEKQKEYTHSLLSIKMFMNYEDLVSSVSVVMILPGKLPSVAAVILTLRESGIS